MKALIVKWPGRDVGIWIVPVFKWHIGISVLWSEQQHRVGDRITGVRIGSLALQVEHPLADDWIFDGFDTVFLGDRVDKIGDDRDGATRTGGRISEDKRDRSRTIGGPFVVRSDSFKCVKPGCALIPTGAEGVIRTGRERRAVLSAVYEKPYVADRAVPILGDARNGK